MPGAGVVHPINGRPERIADHSSYWFGSDRHRGRPTVETIGSRPTVVAPILPDHVF